MNLNTDPIEKLADLLSSCDDNAGHHVIWVDALGEVHITRLGESQAPWEFDGKALFRLETICRWNGYVGPEAARDKRWVSELHARLIREYRGGRRGYVD